LKCISSSLTWEECGTLHAQHPLLSMFGLFDCFLTTPNREGILYLRPWTVLIRCVGWGMGTVTNTQCVEINVTMTWSHIINVYNILLYVPQLSQTYMLSGCELIDAENISLPSQNMKLGGKWAKRTSHKLHILSSRLIFFSINHIHIQMTSINQT
jgi:hypothetical protein